jgi:hypothetical protein
LQYALESPLFKKKYSDPFSTGLQQAFLKEVKPELLGITENSFFLMSHNWGGH